MTSGLVHSLMADLQVIGREAGRKREDRLKEAAETAIEKLRALDASLPAGAVGGVGGSGGVGSEVPGSPTSVLLGLHADVLGPLLEGCKSKTPPVCAAAVGALQKLVSHDLLPPESLPVILQCLSPHVDGNDHSMQVKILQTVLTLLSRSSFMHASLLAHALTICFRLHASRNATVANTAGATLRQVANMLFDRYASEASLLSIPETIVVPAQPGAIPELSPAGFDAYMLFQDLCILTHGGGAHWLGKGTTLSPAFGLELLESILGSHRGVFMGHAGFAALLRDRVCPLVSAPVARYGASFALFTRILRLTAVLIRGYHKSLPTEVGSLLGHLVKVLDPSAPLWHRTLALEVFKALLSDPLLLSSLHSTYAPPSSSLGASADNGPSSNASSPTASVGSSSSTSLAKEGQPRSVAIISGVARFVQRSSVSADSAIVIRSGPVKAKLLEMMHESDAPVVNESYAAGLALEALIASVDSIASLADPSTSSIAGGNPEGATEAAIALAEKGWPSILAGLSVGLAKSDDEDVIQKLLRCFQAFIHSTGLLSLHTPREAFITALCKEAVPPSTPTALPSRSFLPGSAPLVAAASGALGMVTGAIGVVGSLGGGGGGGGSGGDSGSGGNGNRSSLDGGDGNGDGEGGGGGSSDGRKALLSAKNIQAMKTLLNIAHCFGAVLGGDWVLVLEALEGLDAALRLGAVAGHSAVFGSDDGSGAAELSILTSALNGLFDNSSQALDDEALMSLAEALVTVSNKALGDGSAPSSVHPGGVGGVTSKAFGLTRLGEVTRANLERLPLLWSTVSAALISAATHKSVGVRSVGVRAYMELLEIALSSEVVDKEYQAQLLEPILVLASSEASDTREAVLDGLSSTLQSCGHGLTNGWSTVLKVLTEAAGGKEAPATRAAEAARSAALGFSALQIITSDFLQDLDEAALLSVVGAIGAYGQRNGELNIALTSVRLLWEVADALSESQPSQDLWLALFGEVERMCSDRRSEVRSSALQTLFRTLSVHGSSLAPTTWSSCVWKILFPVLVEVTSAAGAAEAGPASPPKLGVGTTGSPVHMMVHHSRNTEAKQWHETKKVALAGVARVFKSYFPVLTELENFPDAWQRMLHFFHEAILSNIEEVSVEAILSFQLILVTHAPEDYFTDEMWDRAWATWEAVAEEATAQDGFDTTILSALVDTLSEVNVRHGKLFGETDTARLLNLLNALAMYPTGTGGSKGRRLSLGKGKSVRLAPLQGSVLKLLEALAPFPDSLWPTVFSTLLGYIAGTIRHPYAPAEASGVIPKLERLSETSIPDGVIPPTEAVLYGTVPLAERSLGVLLELFKNHASEEVRRGVVSELMDVLSAAIETRTVLPESSFWRTAVSTLVGIVPLGLASVEDEAVEPVWRAMTESVGRFLNPPPGQGVEELAVDAQLAAESVDVEVVRMLMRDVLPLVDERSEVPDDVVAGLVRIFSAGSSLSTGEGGGGIVVSGRADGSPRGSGGGGAGNSSNPTVALFGTGTVLGEVSNGSDGGSSTEGKSATPIARQSYAQACLSVLFDAAARGGRVGALAEPELRSRCRNVLETFVADERRLGSFPLSRARLVEVTNVLGRLRDASHDGEVGLLLSLVPALCECIVSKETEVKVLLRELFHAVAVHQGLETKEEAASLLATHIGGGGDSRLDSSPRNRRGRSGSFGGASGFRP